MIPRSILVCAAVLLAWHFAMPRLTRAYYTIPGQQRANYMHAQKFVHDVSQDAEVIVGSSMADRLNEVTLGKKRVKMTFPGGGPFTGLEIIRQTGRRPPVLWIETNVLLRDAEEDLLADVLSPWRMKLRETSPVFKEEGRPSEYGIGFLKAVVDKLGKLAPASAVTQTDGLDGEVFAGIMKANREHLSRSHPEAEMKARAERLGGYVDELMRAGTKCVLFEMPIDSTLRDLAEPAALRKAVKERFPNGKYTWLELEPRREWKTSDGIHLVPEEADQVITRMVEFGKTLR
jgi:hypothetical protein